MKLFIKTISFLLLTSTAMAQNERLQKTYKKVYKSQFAHYVMKGVSLSLEYSNMGAENQIKATKTEDNVTNIYRESTSSPASALGVAISYTVLPRNSFGWSLGMGLINKVESSKNSEASMKYYDNFVQIRPEANVGFAFSNGFYGLIGGHGSFLSGSDITRRADSLGVGFQVSLGYVPSRNYGVDVGYSLSHHRASDEFVDLWQDNSISIEKDQSWFQLKQLRARFSYYF